MSEGAEVTSFKIEHRLDTTVTVNGDTWIKPGVSSAISFDSIPSKEQIEIASKYMTAEILDPIITELVDVVAEKLRKAGAPPNF